MEIRCVAQNLGLAGTSNLTALLRQASLSDHHPGPNLSVCRLVLLVVAFASLDSGDDSASGTSSCWGTDRWPTCDVNTGE
jgi:hypothetical protein